MLTFGMRKMQKVREYTGQRQCSWLAHARPYIIPVTSENVSVQDDHTRILTSCQRDKIVRLARNVICGTTPVSALVW